MVESLTEKMTNRKKIQLNTICITENNDRHQCTYSNDYYQSVLWIRSGFNVDPVPDTTFYLKIQIRIQGAKPMRIHAVPYPDPDLDPCKTLK